MLPGLAQDGVGKIIVKPGDAFLSGDREENNGLFSRQEEDIWSGKVASHYLGKIGVGFLWLVGQGGSYRRVIWGGR